MAAPSEKVIIQLKATGNAPQLKTNKFKVREQDSFKQIIAHIRKYCKLSAEQSLFCFINGSFQPHPEDTVGDLYKCFATGKSLVVNYCLELAWG